MSQAPSENSGRKPRGKVIAPDGLRSGGFGRPAWLIAMAQVGEEGKQTLIKRSSVFDERGWHFVLARLALETLVYKW